jgi:hypothetical protein
MKTRSTILSLAALATFSALAFAPTQASAWGMREGYGSHSYHSMGSRFRASEACSAEFAPTFRRGLESRPRFAQEFGGEREALQSGGYTQAPERGFAPMRQAQGYGPSRQMQGGGYSPSRQFRGLEGHGQRSFGPSRRGHDSFEEAPGVEAQTQLRDNPETGHTEYASKELQR